MPSLRVSPAMLLAALVVLVSVSSLGIARAMAEQLNVNKLKPGAKLEVQRGREWIPAEFVEKISANIIRVTLADSPRPATALVSRTRLAKGNDRPAKTARDDDPFATPEEKLAKAAKQRTWSNNSGKFKVEATLVRIEDANVVLRREDGKEISVPLERLSSKDQQHVAKLTAGSTTDAPSADDGTSQEPAIPITPTDITAASQVSITPDADWAYAPVVASATDFLRPAEVTLRSGSVFQRTVRMLFLPQERKVFAVFSENRGREGTIFQVQSCDVSRRTVGKSVNFGMNIAPLAISPDGKYVVARTEKQGFGGNSELILYARQGAKVTPLAAWLPFRHHASPFAKAPFQKDKDQDPSRPMLGHDADVTWAEFVDAEHLMTVSAGGELAVWQLPKIEAVYYMPATNLVGGGLFNPAMSAANRYFAVATRDGIGLVRSENGLAVGFLPADMHGVHAYRAGWSNDGTQLAMVERGRLRVWDLSTQQLVRDFPIAAVGAPQGCAWADDNHVLLNGRILVDVDRRIPVSVTSRTSGYRTVRGGVVWGFASAGIRQSSIKGTATMPKDFQDPAKGQTAEQLLVIRPGDEVSVELPPSVKIDQTDPRAAVIERLEKNGMKIVPQSKTRLVGTLKNGATKTVQYKGFGRRSKVTETSVTEQILTLSLVVDGDTVWKYESRTGAPRFVRFEEGETLTQAIARVRKLSGSGFSRVWVPAWVARVPDSVQTALTGKQAKK